MGSSNLPRDAAYWCMQINSG